MSLAIYEYKNIGEAHTIINVEEKHKSILKLTQRPAKNKFEET